MNRTVDYSALLFPVTRDEVREFKRAHNSAGSVYWNGLLVKTLVIYLACAVIAFLLLTTMVPALVHAVTHAGDGRLIDAVDLIGPLAFIAAGIGAIAWLLRGVHGLAQWERWMRVDRFARANGFAFSPQSPGPNYPGSIFEVGTSRRVLNELRSLDGRQVHLGNYEYVTGSGKNRTTHNWGFLAMRLDRRLPHMMLDARSNNGLFGMSNLPGAFARDQRLSLEGDFDRYFTLYAPKQYERDALYVFTPDLMALLIDEAAPFDVEIVDDWLFVYSPKPFRVADPAVYQRLLRIVDTVGAKTLRQSDRYVDDTVGDYSANYVAPRGQRLKKGVSVGSVVVGVILVGYWLLTITDWFN